VLTELIPLPDLFDLAAQATLNAFIQGTDVESLSLGPSEDDSKLPTMSLNGGSISKDSNKKSG
jgi:hypothetical protein